MLHIIPNYREAMKWVAIAKEMNAAFEYNDFFIPAVLSDNNKMNEIAQVYRSLDRDCSQDTLHGAFFDIVIDSTDPLIKQVSDFRVHQSMEMAKLIGCRAVVFHSNYITGFKSFPYRDRWVKENAEYYHNLLNEYPMLEVYIENMFDDSPELLRRLAEAMSDEPRFGLCFDAAHAYLWNLPLGTWLDQLSPYIRHVHINDNFKDEDSHLAIGTGTLPWDILRDDRLRRNNPSILIEVNNEEKLRQSYEFLVNNDLL